MSPSREPSTLRQLGALAGAGLQFAVTVALCTAAGWWLDGRWSSSPWGLLAGGLLGSVAAFYQLYRTLTAASRDDRRRSTRQTPTPPPSDAEETTREC